MLPALGHGLGQGEMPGSTGAEPFLLRLHPILGGGHVGRGPQSGVRVMRLCSSGYCRDGSWYERSPAHAGAARGV